VPSTISDQRSRLSCSIPARPRQRKLAAATVNEELEPVMGELPERLAKPRDGYRSGASDQLPERCQDRARSPGYRPDNSHSRAAKKSDVQGNFEDILDPWSMTEPGIPEKQLSLKGEGSMRSLILIAALALAWLPSSGAEGAETDKPGFAVPDDLVDAWERLQRALQDWGGQLRERFGSREARDERPMISLMLKHSEQLRLSPEQVKKLEQLRDQYQRQSIRAEADTRILELDISSLLEQTNVDLPKVEQKIRELEKLRADLRIARVRSVEQAKATLTADQRKRFYELLDPRSRSNPQNPTAEKNKTSPS
jgi:Spy/CpxP family protein refolding chaperone